MIKYWVMFAMLDTGVSYYKTPFPTYDACIAGIIENGWADKDRWPDHHMPSVIGCYEYSEHHSVALHELQRSLMWQGPLKRFGIK